LQNDPRVEPAGKFVRREERVGGWVVSLVQHKPRVLIGRVTKGIVPHLSERQGIVWRRRVIEDISGRRSERDDSHPAEAGLHRQTPDPRERDVLLDDGFFTHSELRERLAGVR